MATQIQRRRGTTTQHSTFTGANGELTVDTTLKTVVVHDGSTAGGFPLLRANGAQNATTTGTSTAASFIPTSSTVPTNGVYLSASNTVALATNSTGRVFVDADGNLGVGHTPTQKLSVLGAIRTQTTASGTTGYEIFNGTRNTGISSDFANSLTFIDHNQTLVFRDSQNAYAERLRLTSDGRLGVGTSAPDNLADVNGAVGVLYGGALGGLRLFRNTGTVNNAILQHTFTGGNDQLEIAPAGNSATSAIAFLTATGSTLGTRMLISPAGNVGIGTASPTEFVELYKASGSCNLRVTSGSRFGNFAQNGTDTYLTNSSNGPIQFWTNGNERFRCDSSGRLLVGTSSVRDAGGNFGASTGKHIHVETTDIAVFTGIANKADAGGAFLVLGKSRSASIGGTTAVQSGDLLGTIKFAGANGSDLSNIAGQIECLVDGAVTGGGAGDMPGRLVFSTTADGASLPTERVRVTSGGYFKASNDGSYQGVNDLSHELRQTGTARGVIASASNGSYADAVLTANATRAANSAYNFLDCYSGNFGDLEVRLTGEGNGRCDGSWTGGGADYAEYFEWSDGNPNEEDRRGIAVVLDGEKIRPALAGEDPIGVISGNPSVVGDAAWNKWSGKYLRDEFGTYILEDYEVEDEDGNTVVQQRRKLNPAYDPDVEYISREQRPEWDCVGLMGKLRLRKGQPTGSRWIKMRDISANVEEWLVR